MKADRVQRSRGSAATARLPAAPGSRRALSLIYETILLTAVGFAATAVLVVIAHLAGQTLPRWVIQLWLGVVAACYFVPQWRAGETLPMRTWRIRVVNRAGGPLTTQQAIARYLGALGSVLLFGVGFLWALADKDGQFLHDRLAGTRLVTLPRQQRAAGVDEAP